MAKAVIVGASSGIGLEVAHQLLAEGWQLGVASRREDLLTYAQDSLTQPYLAVPSIIR